jgi:hypothetical protein
MQWTGDDSKALMKISCFLYDSEFLLILFKVYITTVKDFISSKMVQCLTSFMNCCYIVWHNVITSTDVTRYCEELQCFHELQKVFIETGVCTSVELPRQHVMMHYADVIKLFGSKWHL